MAEKIVSVDLRVNTGSSKEGVDQLNQSLQQTDKNIEAINQEGQQLTLDQKLASINDEVKSGELNFQQLGKKLKEYQTIAIAAGRDSPIGQQALADAANLKDQLDGLQQEVKMLSHDALGMKAAMQLGQGVIGGMSAFKGITAAIGVENENLMKVMTQLQGLQAASMGIEQLHNLTRKESALAIKATQIAQKAWNATIMVGDKLLKMFNLTQTVGTKGLKAFRVALASTGIGLLIVGLTLLITKFDSVVAWVKDAIGWFANFGEVVVQVAEWFGLAEKGSADLMRQERKASEERKKQEKGLAEAHKARMQQIDEQMNATISAADETIKALELEKDTLEAQGKASDEATVKILEAEKAKLEAVLEANSQKVASYVKYYTDLAALRGQDEEEFKKSMLAQGIDLDMLQEKANKLIEENEANVQYAENRITKFKREQGEKQAADAKAIQDKIKSDREKALADMMALEMAITDLRLANMKDGIDKEIAMLAEKQRRERAAMIKQHGENSELMKQLDEKHLQELEAIHAKYESQTQKKNEELLNMRLNNMEEGAEKEKAILAAKHAKEEQDLRTKYGEDTEMLKELKIQQEGELNALQAELDEQAKEARRAKIQEGIEMAEQFLAAANQINDMINEIQDRKIERLEADRDKQLTIIEQQKRGELAQEGLTADQKIAIENKFALEEWKTKVKAAKEKDKIDEKQFKRTKALKMTEIAINTAASVMQALGGFPPPASFIFAGINAAMGIAQMAVVGSQKFKSSSGSIAPPSFNSPSISGSTGSGGGGADASGSQQTDTTTSTSDLLNQGQMSTKVTISQVELKESENELVQMEQVSTL